MDAVVGAAAQADELEQLLDPRRRDTMQARVEAQVLAPGQVAEDERLVAEQPDPPAHRPAVAGELVAENARAARMQAQQRGQHAQQRRLPRPVGPNTTSVAPVGTRRVTSSSATRSP